MQLGNLFCKIHSKQSRLWRPPHPHHFKKKKKNSSSRMEQLASSTRQQSRRTCTHFLLQEHQNHNQLLSNHQQKDAGTHQKKDTSPPKTKKLQQDGRRGTITVKSNPIPTGWVTHRLENIKPKKFSLCCEGSEPRIRLPNWRSDRSGNPRESGLEGQQDLILRLPQDEGKQ